MLSLNEADAREFYEGCWSPVFVAGRVATWLDGLRFRHKLAALSNGWSNDRHECEERTGSSRFFDVMLFSGQEGVAKPAPEIYERTFNA